MRVLSCVMKMFLVCRSNSSILSTNAIPIGWRWSHGGWGRIEGGVDRKGWRERRGDQELKEGDKNDHLPIKKLKYIRI